MITTLDYCILHIYLYKEKKNLRSQRTIYMHAPLREIDTGLKFQNHLYGVCDVCTGPFTSSPSDPT